MPSPKLQRPPTLRYLKAKFIPFTNPLFWSSLGFLSIFAFSVWQYWHHPEWIDGQMDHTDIAISSLSDESQEMLANSDISIEELAAAAEIDSLPLLLNDFKFKEVKPASLPEPPESQDTSENLFDSVLQAETENTAQESTQQTRQDGLSINPFGNTGLFVNVKAEESQPSASNNTNNTMSAMANSNSLNALITTPSQTQLLSPLQIALNQLNSANSRPETATSDKENPNQTAKESQTDSSQGETVPNQDAANASQKGDATSPHTSPTDQSDPPGQVTYPGYSYPTTSTNPYTPATPTPTYPTNAYTYLTQPQPLTPATPNPNYGQYATPGVPQRGIAGNNTGVTNPSVSRGFPQSQLNQSALTSPFGTQPQVQTVPRSNFDT
ncbi:MAG: hypothetical protein ACOC0N_04665, partial [Chroococcales cyanobacterium]